MENVQNTNDALKIVTEIKSAQDAAAGAVAKAEGLEAKNEELSNEVKSLKEENTKLADDQKVLQKNLDDAKAEFKSIAVSTKAKRKGPWAQAVEEMMDSKDALLKGGKLELDIKDVNYGTGDAANVPMEERIADIKVDPHFPNAIRNHIAMKPTSAESIRYNRRDAIASSSTPVAGLALNQDASTRSAFSDYSPTLQNIKTNVITFGAITTINEEQLDDVLGLQSFLSNDLMGFAMDRESLELLQGTDNGTTSLQSFNSDGTAWVDQRSSGAAAITEANFFDVIVNGIAQLAANNYTASKVFVNPVDFWGDNFALSKSTQGEYVYQQMMKTGTAFLGGAEIVISPAVTANSAYIISDGSCAYHLREGIGVEFYRQNDDFAKNNISVRVKLRGAHTIYLPGGIVRVSNLETARTELAAQQA